MTCLGQALDMGSTGYHDLMVMEVRRDVLGTLRYLGITWECSCNGHT